MLLNRLSVRVSSICRGSVAETCWHQKAKAYGIKVHLTGIFDVTPIGKPDLAQVIEMRLRSFAIAVMNGFYLVFA